MDYLQYYSSHSSSFQVNMDHSQDCYENSGEDDSIYAELKKQILILTADDDDDYFTEKSKVAPKHGSKKNIGLTTAKAQGSYFDWTENEKRDNSVPNGISKLWRSNGNVINGTGVFIPDIVKSRSRNNRPRRRKNDRRMYKSVAN